MELLDIKINRRSDIISGILEKESSEWILLHANPIDFLIDGICLVNKKYIKKIENTQEKDFKHKVMKMKYLLAKEFSFDVDSTYDLFYYFQKNNILLQLEFESDDYCFIGQVTKMNEHSFLFNELSYEGAYLGEENLRYDRVRNIYVNNDYLNSYKIYLDHKK